MLESACAGFLALRDKATEILRRGEASSASAAREMGARWRWSDFGTRWEQTLPVWPEEHSPYLAIVATDIFFSAYR